MTIKYSEGRLTVLNQLLLPFETVYEDVSSCEDGHHQIKSMKVRGAPLIAIVAALSLAVEIKARKFPSAKDACDYINLRLEYLKTSRPTAVNLFNAADNLSIVALAALHRVGTAEAVVNEFIVAAELMLQKDVLDNRAIGRLGADFILQNTTSVQVLTHCNTGSLATAGWGTALGVIRDLNARNCLEHAYCTETRPYNQGSRLTAYELVSENIPSTLICDSMVSALLSKGNISAIIVGADRVAANGDTANKIGTYQLAIAAAYHKVHFIVAAPTTTIDLATKSGHQIVIEERHPAEVANTRGRDISSQLYTVVETVAPGINIWNPAFDVTPASLISAIVTENGVIVKPQGASEFDLSNSIQSTQVIFVLGGPGSGKGTNCAKLVNDLGFVHLSAGDLLREERARAGSATGELIESYIKQGLIVPSEITIGLLKAAMQNSMSKRFLIDGFPRKMDQALDFEIQVSKCSAVLFFDCTEEEMERRLLKRGNLR
jgi:methylthioribose-1-phosphate isomerase